MITVDEVQLYEYKTTKELLLVIKMIIYRMNFKPENLILEIFLHSLGA